MHKIIDETGYAFLYVTTYAEAERLVSDASKYFGDVWRIETIM
jgi:hypothetical protein